MTPRSVVIADDEPLALEGLSRLVARDARLVLLASATNGPDAIRQIDTRKPDLVFLDIKMPGATGIEVARRINHRPAIVFTTAYDDYAVTAFELQALDYLLKPFGRRRFQRAVDRIFDTGFASGGAHLKVADPVHRDEPLSRILVREQQRTRSIPVNAIIRIDAADDYVRVVSDGGSPALVAVRMKQLEGLLDTSRFVRVHRSTVVQVDRVDQIVDIGNGRRELILSDGSRCHASRAGAARLADAMQRFDPRHPSNRERT